MSGRTEREMHTASFRWRAYLLFGVLACSAIALVWRAVDLQLIDKGFLQKRGTQNFSRVIGKQRDRVELAFPELDPQRRQQFAKQRVLPLVQPLAGAPPEKSAGSAVDGLRQSLAEHGG